MRVLEVCPVFFFHCVLLLWGLTIGRLYVRQEQDDAAAKATKIWNTLLKMLDAAEVGRLGRDRSRRPLVIAGDGSNCCCCCC